MTTVIGFDPGATIGACRIDIGGSAARGFTAGWIDSSSVRISPNDRFFVHHMKALIIGCDVVAIEEVSGFPHGKANFVRSKHLTEAAKVGQAIATIAQMLGKPVHQMTAARVRSMLCGRNNPSDPEVKSAVHRLIRNVPGHTNAHERDAALVAVAVGWSKPLAVRTA